MTTSKYQCLKALEMSSNQHSLADADDPMPGLRVATYDGLFVDEDMELADVAAMVVLMFGAEYADKLVDALIDALKG